MKNSLIRDTACIVHLNQALVKIKQSVTACFSYHGTLRPTVQEAAGRFFVEAVVGSRSFGHLLHDHLGLDVLLCSGIYCDVRPLKTHGTQVESNDIWHLCSYSTSNHIYNAATAGK